MARFSNRLKHVQVAAPCKVNWDEMLGDERVRFCGQCSLNVYNLSSMTRAYAEALIARTEGRLCVKFYRRFDGSISQRIARLVWQRSNAGVLCLAGPLFNDAHFFGGLWNSSGLFEHPLLCPRTNSRSDGED